MDASIIDKAIERLKTLPEELQWRVLEVTCVWAQSTPHGVSDRQLLHLADAISPEDAESMCETIERGCEQVEDRRTSK